VVLQVIKVQVVLKGQLDHKEIKEIQVPQVTKVHKVLLGILDLLEIKDHKV
jgi:hypothetical protein